MKYRPLLISALLLSFSVPALSWGPGPKPMERPDFAANMAETMEKVANETLELDSKRQKQLKKLLEKHTAERQKLAEKHKALRAESKKQHDEFKTKMDELLTDEERTALHKAMKKEMRAAYHAKGERPMKGKKSKGDRCDNSPAKTEEANDEG